MNKKCKFCRRRSVTQCEKCNKPQVFCWCCVLKSSQCHLCWSTLCEDCLRVIKINGIGIEICEKCCRVVVNFHETGGNPPDKLCDVCEKNPQRTFGKCATCKKHLCWTCWFGKGYKGVCICPKCAYEGRITKGLNTIFKESKKDGSVTFDIPQTQKQNRN